jgi:hypothetical protein
MMRRHRDTIDVIGVNGDFCRISDPNLTWGPYLAPGSTGLYDMPIQTNWGSYGFGQFFQSWKPKRRDVVWTVHILNPENGSQMDQDEHLWHLIYSRWKAMFSPQNECTIVYTSLDGPRELKLRNLQEPKPFSSQNFEGGDPHRFSYGSVVQTMAAELPFYVGPSESFSVEFTGAGDFWQTMPYYNPSSVEIFPEWDLTWGAQYILPDYSYGCEYYGRGKSDSGKTVPTPTLIEADGNVTVYTRPDKRTYVSEMETPVGLRSKGLDFEYPIAPGAGDPDEGCVVRARNVTDGCAITLTLPRWYAEPFSTPLVV